MESIEKHFDIAFAAPNGIKKLRELILTLAMQGKLVPQDPNDQPASELLKEIEAEKRRLVKEKKIKEPKPLPDINPEEVPYALPESWEWVRLGEIGITQTGTTPRSGDNSSYGNEYPFIKPADIKFSGVNYENEGLSETGLQKYGRVACAGSSLMVCIGTIGKTNLIEKDCSFNQQINSLTPYNPIDSYYVQMFLRSPYFQKEAWNRSSSTTIAILNKGRWESIPIALPPVSEQHRIVAKIDQLMARCDELEKLRAEREQKRLTVHISALNSLLEAQEPDSFAAVWHFINRHFGELYSVKENVTELRKAILQLAVMGKLVPQDPNDQPAREILKEIEAEKRRLVKEGKIKPQKPLPEIKPEEMSYELPKGWVWVRLNEVFDVRDGTHDTPKYVEVGYPLITSKNLYTGRLSFEDVKYISEADHLKIIERSKVDLGDILFAMIGSIGNPVIVDNIQEFSIKNVALFKFYKTNTPDNRFLHYFLLNVQRGMKEKSSGAVQSFVSLGFLRQYLFPLPPLGEQQRIVAKIDQFMALCDQLEQQIDATACKQSAVLNAVMANI